MSRPRGQVLKSLGNKVGLQDFAKACGGIMPWHVHSAHISGQWPDGLLAWRLLDVFFVCVNVRAVRCGLVQCGSVECSVCTCARWSYFRPRPRRYASAECAEFPCILKKAPTRKRAIVARHALCHFLMPVSLRVTAGAEVAAYSTGLRQLTVQSQAPVVLAVIWMTPKQYLDNRAGRQP